MQRAVRFALILALAGSAGAQSAQPTGSVEGIVVSLDTGKPIENAAVELTGIASPPSETAPTDWKVLSFTARTNRDGAFSISGIPPGTAYQLVATRPPDFAPAAFGQSRPGDPWVSIGVAAGQRLTGLRLSLKEFSSISGRVSYENRKPVRGMPISALSVGYQDGVRLLRDAGIGFTDDDGNYRIAGLKPGRYVLRIGPIRSTSWPSHYYFPGVTEPERATTIEIHETESLTGLDLVTAEMPMWTVRGQVVDAVSGEPIRQARVFLVPPETFPDSSMVRENESKNDFEFPRVAPGSYRLFAVGESGGRMMSGSLAIEVGEKEPREFRISIQPQVDVTGRIFVEGADLTAFDFSRITIRLHSDAPGTVDLGRFPSISRSVSAVPAILTSASPTGTFQLKGIRAWPYFATVDLPADVTWQHVYLDSIRSGSANLLDSPPRALSAPLEVVLRNDGGSVSGTVKDEMGNAVPYAVVVSVPDIEKRSRRDLYKTAKADHTGSFTLRGIAPGNYSVFAWRRVDAGAWYSHDFIEGYEDRATAVTINALSDSHVSLRVF